MSPLDGLNTWFEYEVSITVLVVALVVVLWTVNRLIEYLELVESLRSLPVTSLPFALAFTAAGFLAILLLIGLAGRYN